MASSSPESLFTSLSPFNNISNTVHLIIFYSQPHKLYMAIIQKVVHTQNKPYQTNFLYQKKTNGGPSQKNIEHCDITVQ